MSHDPVTASARSGPDKPGVDSQHPTALHTIALRADHLPAATGLSSALGWPYRLEDWRFAYALGSGFAVEADGKLVATALWWPQGETHACLGMIIVSPELQGRGIGRLLMDRLLQATEGRTLMLNSTQQGLKLYSQLGFEAHGRVYQHQAVFETPMPDRHHAGDARPMLATDEQQVRALDAQATGLDRRALLDALFSVATVTVLDRGQGPCAYACARPFGRGVVIGPVVASGPSSAADAKALISRIAGTFQHQFLRLDVTEESGLSPWLSTMGLPCVDQAVPMTRGPVADPSTSAASARLFALSNQSFG
jgi:GNAT superfamily N-acetyltransferase